MKKRNLRGQFSRRKHYRLPEERIKPVLLYYYAGLGVLGSAYLIGCAFCASFNELKQIYNEYAESTRIIVINEVGARTDDRVDVISGKNESVEPEVSQPLSIEQKIKEVFGEEAKIMTAISKAESGLNPYKASETDHTLDGLPYSIGLFQINLTVHSINGVDCPSAFVGRNNDARVVNEQLYNQCVALASDYKVNIDKAKQILNEAGLYAWSVFRNKSYLKFI
jgi:hypothetical protein